MNFYGIFFHEMCWSSIISINVCTYIHVLVYGSQVFMYSKLFTSAFMSASVVKTCKKIKFGFSKIHGIKFAA